MKSKSKLVALVVVILVAGGTGLWLLRDSPKTTQTPGSNAGQSTTQNQPSAQALQPAKTEAADFTYQKPQGWVAIAKDRLGSSGAISGIGRPTEPKVTFSVKVSDSVPKDSNDLKNNALNDIKKNAPNFALVSSADTKVDGKSGQKFIYVFGSQDRIKQEMTVIIYKQKTFFLLFTAAEADFDKSSAEFAQILADFKFI